MYNQFPQGAAPRRATGCLRNLIRLHEDEIARASGDFKRAKSDTFLQSSSISVEGITERPNNSKISNIYKNTQKGAFEYQVNCNYSEFLEDSRNSPSLLPHDVQSIATNFSCSIKVDKSTFTEMCFVDDGSCAEKNKRIAESEEEVSRLVSQRDELLLQLEEQKKVANAYQKLENRYRKKVYELERIVNNCTCGGCMNGKTPRHPEGSKTFPRFV